MKTDQFIHVLTQDLQARPASVQKVLAIALPAAATVVTLSWLAVVGVRIDVMSTGLGPTAIKLVLGVQMAVIGLSGVLRLSRPEAGPRSLVLGLIAIPSVALLAAAFEWQFIGIEGWQARLFGKGTLVCLTVIPALALLPLTASLFALRQGATTRPCAAGAFAGLTGAGIAIIGYGLFCTENSAYFIGTWYLLAGCIASTFGALAGLFVLRW